MDWMYKGVSGLVDNEEYLKGRKIDKTFEVIQSENTKTKKDNFETSIAGSLFDSNQSTNSLVTIDLAAKLREDPLYEIRVKQREQRKKILDNPLKLKKLKQMLETNLAEEEDKHKKNKKKKKRSKRHSSSSGSDTDSHSDHLNRKRHRSSERLNDTRVESRHKYHSNREKDKRDDRRDFSRKSYKRYDFNLKVERDSQNDRRIEKHFDKSTDILKSKKLSAEELQRKRNEMLENAVWRECQRKSNVKSYEAQEKAENEFNSSSNSPQFIKPLLKSAAESKTLEERIKQKRFRSQRGYDSMDTNFAKK